MFMTWENITGAVTNVTSVMGTVLDAIVDNPMLMVMLAVPVVGAGVIVFKKLIKAVKC